MSEMNKFFLHFLLPCFQEQPSKPLVPLKGARKVWKTFKFVTVSVVSHAIHSITGISTDELSIKRKFRHSSEKRVATWWFVIRGEDAVLEKLDSMWPQVQLQTNWELKPLMAFGDVTPDSEGLPSTNPIADVSQTTSQEGTNSGDEPLSSTSFCQTQIPTLVT